MSTSRRLLYLCTCLALPMLVTGCSSSLNRLEEVGRAPSGQPVKDPTHEAGYEPMSWPMPESKPPAKQYANSLWQPGARAFFRDQRANRVGDLVRVNIKIADKAQLNNETERKRDAADSSAAPAVAGLESKIFHALPGIANPAKLFDVTNKTNSKGTGTVKREEKIETQIAAIVTQILPNGNFVIDGTQEVTVNFDLRQIAVKGVIRPEDIKSDNTIDLAQIAEARVMYGGHGQLMDVQQPRWGNQVIEALSPF
jgi:flagellar L-ring protein precursor FlgH